MNASLLYVTLGPLQQWLFLCLVTAVAVAAEVHIIKYNRATPLLIRLGVCLVVLVWVLIWLTVLVDVLTGRPSTVSFNTCLLLAAMLLILAGDRRQPPPPAAPVADRHAHKTKPPAKAKKHDPDHPKTTRSHRPVSA